MTRNPQNCFFKLIIYRNFKYTADFTDALLFNNEPRFEKVKCLLPKSYSWLLTVIGHKYTCVGPLVKDLMLLLIKA